MHYAAILPPKTLLDDVIDNQRSVQFALGQHMEQGNYLHYFKTYKENFPSGVLIVDNGAAEKDEEQVDFYKIAGYAKQANADYVLLPDVLRDGDATYEATKDGSYWVAPYDRAIVPQGKSWNAWKECLFKMQGFFGESGFSMICLPKLLEDETMYPGGRAHALHILTELGIIDRYVIHMLGFYDNPIREIKNVYDYREEIFSWDSGAAAAYAQKKKSITNINRESLVWNATPVTSYLQDNINVLDMLMGESMEIIGQILDD